jgi:hypothetical protein
MDDPENARAMISRDDAADVLLDSLQNAIERRQQYRLNFSVLVRRSPLRNSWLAAVRLGDTTLTASHPMSAIDATIALFQKLGYPSELAALAIEHALLEGILRTSSSPPPPAGPAASTSPPDSTPTS